MSLPLADYGTTRRSIFYDELSHLNPIYAAPGHNDLLSLEWERRYHLHNLRLLSLYFENIIFMTGNLLNLPNHTTKAVIFEVISDKCFSELCETGVIVFCGWGARLSHDMIQNQVDYARLYKPDLKDISAIDRLRSLTSLSTVLVREESDGEEDFIDTFLQRMQIRAERSTHKDWKRVDGLAKSVQTSVGYLGTMEFFPLLSKLDPVIRRGAHEVYLDAWIDYAAQRYHPVATYESPRYRLNIYRTVPSQVGKNEGLASILLSPQFFQSVLLRFMDEDEFTRLLNLSPRRLVRLRNGDWAIFCTRYHSYLEACSEALWRIQILSQGSAPPSPEVLFEDVIRKTMDARSGSLDVAFFADFLSHAIGFFYGIPGLSALLTSIFKPMSGYLNQRASSMMRNIQMRELYPFIAKMRAAAA